jgi:hypothetical protein
MTIESIGKQEAFPGMKCHFEAIRKVVEVVEEE